MSRAAVLHTTLLFAAAALAAGITAAGPGLSWDEPTYRESQVRVEQWLGELNQSHDPALLGREEIGHYWNFNRLGANFHPPMASYLNMATGWLFDRWIDDVTARRLASSLEFAAAVALAGAFVAACRGWTAGWFAGLSLLFMPRLMGDAHIIGTDMPLMFFWAAAAIAFLQCGRSRVRQWILALLCACLFLVKFSGAVLAVPLGVWFVAKELRGSHRFGRWALRSLLLFGPALPAAAVIVFSGAAASGDRPARAMEQAILGRPVFAFALLCWPILGLLLHYFRSARRSDGDWKIGLETPWVVFAVAPLLCIALNPTWWRDPVVGLSSYFHLNLARHGIHPDVAIYYLGRKYINSLPWHNAFVLMAVTIPLGTLAVGLIGCFSALRRNAPMELKYLLLQAMTLPLFRMLPTPAHDGVRLFLPTFFFWAAIGGFAAASLAGRRVWIWCLLFAIGPAWSMSDWIRVHPHELSYYSVGLRKAADWGMETTYWYDAVTRDVLETLNNGDDSHPPLPQRAAVIVHLDPTTNTETFRWLQTLGRLRSDLNLDPRPITCSTWTLLLGHSSKSTPLKRILYCCQPWYEKRFQGEVLFSVHEPRAFNVACALAAMTIVRGHTDEYRAAEVFEPAFAARPFDYACAAAIYQHGKVPGRTPASSVLLQHWQMNTPSALLLSQIQREDPGAIEQAARLMQERPDDIRRMIESAGYVRSELFAKGSLAIR